MGGGHSVQRVSYAGGGYGDRNSTLNEYSEGEEKKVFISHSMRDHAQAGLLAYQAENENFDVEFDDTSLQNPVRGRDWHPVVERKIKYSDVLVVMVGEDTATRRAVDYEVRTAHKHGVPVIPVRIHRGKNHRLSKPIVQYGYEVSDWDTEEIQNRINMAS